MERACQADEYDAGDAAAWQSPQIPSEAQRATRDLYLVVQHRYLGTRLAIAEAKQVSHWSSRTPLAPRTWSGSNTSRSPANPIACPNRSSPCELADQSPRTDPDGARRCRRNPHAAGTSGHTAQRGVAAHHGQRRIVTRDDFWDKPGPDLAHGCWGRVLYDPDLFASGQSSDPAYKVLDRQQYRAATTAAFTMLVYVFLQVLADRLERATSQRIPILMLRFQTQGREAAGTDGNTIIYASAQAVEAALMRDAPVRMQGMVCTPGDAARPFRDAGMAFALHSAFPLVLSTPGPPADVPRAQRMSAGTLTTPVAPKVALLVYSTRPCDEHPAVSACRRV